MPKRIGIFFEKLNNSYMHVLPFMNK
jgi:hypothetical protein